MLVWSSYEPEVMKKKIACHQELLGSYIFTNDVDQLKYSEILMGAVPFDKLPDDKVYEWIHLVSVDTSKAKGARTKKLTNIRGLLSKPIAETIVGSALAFYRGLYQLNECQIKRRWNRWPIRYQSQSLSGKHVLFLGGGSIAQATIKLLSGFDCRFTVFRRQKSNQGLAEAGVITERTQLIDQLGKFDLVVNTLPNSDATTSFCDADFIDRLQGSCLFVNVGRGDTVDELALVEALRTEKLAAAILDVTQAEPVPEDSPLWLVENLYLTQHSSAGHRHEEDMKIDSFIENLIRYQSGAPLLNEVKDD